MLCEKCKKNEAKINLVKIVNGQKHEIWLCEKCAKDISDIPFLNSIGKEINFPFQGILTGLLGNIDNIKEKQTKIICPNCGLTYDELIKQKKIGCCNCYKAFQDVIQPIIKKIQFGTTHIGKIPKLKGKELIKRRTIKELKQKLQKLISLEEYEEAAIIRDKINELQLSIREDNIQEKEVQVKGEEYNEKLD